jgi:hypothetical protein
MRRTSDLRIELTIRQRFAALHKTEKSSEKLDFYKAMSAV